MKIQTITAKIDAAQDDLVVPLIAKVAQSFQDYFRVKRTASSSCMGNNAISTESVATVLDLQKGPSSFPKLSNRKILKWLRL